MILDRGLIVTLADLVAYAAKTALPSRPDPELAFYKLIQSTNHVAVRVGWPDFVVFAPDGNLKALVEVKRNSAQTLPAHQELVLRGFAAFSIPCFHWSPDGGLVKVNEDGTFESASMNCLGVDTP